MIDHKPKVLFLFEHENTDYWKDGLWAALRLLENDFQIYKHNFHDKNPELPINPDKVDFILGWGAFGSKADNEIQKRAYVQKNVYGKPYKTGLCIAGNATSPSGLEHYSVLFYETEWYKPQIESHPNIIHAFGVNTDIFKPQKTAVKLWDYLTVGAFAKWKRQEKILALNGARMAIGQIQRSNMQESIGIIGNLLISHCGVSDEVSPEELVNYYNVTRNVYIPADINGGGERAILEARACGIPVIIEPDNPKLTEVVQGPIYDHVYYAEQLKKGILSCL